MTDYSIEKSAIWLDIKAVIGSGKKSIKYEYRALLHNEKEDINIFKVKAIDIIRDYSTKINEIIQIEFDMLLGDYVRRLYPYRNNLELTIKKIELQEVAAKKENDTSIQTERYKAIFLPKENPVANVSELESIDTETINKGGMVTVKLQLLNRSIEPIRIITTHGAFRTITQKQLLHSVMAGELVKVKVDGKPAIDGFDITEPNNTELRKHVIIPDGTLVSSLPTFLQEKSGGVYNAAIGTFLQRYNNKNIWFVYPLFNYKRFDTDVVKAIFFSVPENRLPGIDRTFNVDGKLINIIVTSKRKYQDSAGTNFMNKGVGFRMADANAYMKKPVIMTEEGSVSDRSRLNYETSLKENKDGLNYAPKVGASSNPYMEYSKVILSSMSQIDLVWENSDNSLLYPGMPCKFVFMDRNKLIELKGTILYTHTLITLQSKTVNDIVYKNVTHITIASEPYDNQPDPPNFKSAGDF